MNFLAIFAVIFISNAADAAVRDTITLRVFNRDFSLTDTEMLQVLKKADLERHGFTKETVTKLVSQSGSDKTSYQKMYYFYKTVACSKVQEVEQEIDTLLSGVLGTNVLTKLNQDMRMRNLNKAKKCKAGIEVHFRGQEKCGKNKARSRRSPCVYCVLCSWVNIAE